MRIIGILICLIFMNSMSIKNNVVGIIRHDVDIERYRELGGEYEVADHLFPFCPDHQFSDRVTTQFRHH